MERIGIGGLGEVWRATDSTLGRDVALKVLREDRSAYAALRFSREARITALLDHPGIVPVHDTGRTPGGRAFYAMRWVRGHTLKEALRDAQGLPGRMLLRGHYVAMCNAAAHAHARGVVHRDLKPANVIVGEFGETQLLDWGLAKVVGETDLSESSFFGDADPSAEVTRDGVVLGTPAYMAAEQAGQQPVDARSDVFALGVVLYELLTEVSPFKGSTGEETLARLRSGKRAAVLELCPDAPPDLAAVCEKTLSLRPDDRYPDAGALAAEVEAWRQGRLVSAYAYAAGDIIRRFVRRYRVGVLMSVVALLLFIGLSAWSGRRIVVERDRALSQLERAVREEGDARNQLAEALIGRARAAQEVGRRTTAEVYAAGALQLREDPEARGMVLWARSQWHPILEQEITFAGRCASIAAIDRGLGCIGPGGLARWDGRNAPTTLDKRPGTYVTAAPDGAIVTLRADDGGPLEVLRNGVTARVPVERGIRGHTVDVNDGGDRIAVARAGRAEVVDALTGEVLWGHPTHGDTRVVQWSGDTLWVGDHTGSVHAVRDGEVYLAADLQIPGVFALAVAPDGTVAVGSSRTLVLWTPGSEPRRYAIDAGIVLHLAWAQNSATLVLGTEQGSVLLWDVAEGRTRLELPEQPRLEGLAFVGDRLAVASGATVQLWQMGAPHGTDRLAAGEGIGAVAWSADRARVVAGTGDGRLVTWDGATGERLDERRVARVVVKSVAVLPDGRVAYSLPASNPVVLDPTTGATVELPGGGFTVPRLLVDPSGGLVWGDYQGNVSRGTADGEVADQWVTRDGVHRLAFFGSAIVATDHGGRVNVLEPGGVVRSRLLGDVRSVAADGARGRIWAGLADGTLVTLDGALAEIGRTHAHAATVHGLELSPDRQLLASVGWDRAVRIWAAEDGALLAILWGHGDRVSAVAWSPDSRRLATGSWDHTMRIWDVAELYRPPAQVLSDAAERYGLGLDGGRLARVPTKTNRL
ncbi:MAG: WD40 repeat protein [Myxococcota bacterium]